MGKQLDGANLNQADTEKSTVESIIERQPDVDTQTKGTVTEPAPSTEETKEKVASEPSGETETEEIVITPDENVVVTEEIAEAFGLDKDFIGKTVKFSEEEILAAESNQSTATDESIGDTEITEEIAEILGLPKTFIGKPLRDAGKSYKETVKWENENNKQIKELKSTVEALVSKLSNKELNQLDKEASSEAADVIPDPTIEPEEFAKWLQKRDDLFMTKVLDKIGEDPSIKATRDMALKQMEIEAMNTLQNGLPDDVDAQDVMDKWFEDNKDDYQDMVDAKLYKNKPAKLVKDVLTWYKANSYDSLKNMKESDIKKQVHKKTVENLKAKGNRTKTNYSSNPRPKVGQKDTAVSRILRNLQERQATRDSA